MNITREVSEIANELSEITGVEIEKCLIPAVEIQRNQLIKDIFVLGTGEPSALEAIAIALGYAK